MFSFKSYQFKLFITYSLLMIFFTALIGIPMYLYLKRNIQTNITTSFEQKVKNTADKLDQLLLQYQNMTKQLYLDTNNSGIAMTEYLDKVSRENREIDLLNANKIIYNYLSLTTELYKEVHRMTIFKASGEIFSNLNLEIRPFLLMTPEKLQAIRRVEGAGQIYFSNHDPWLQASDTNNRAMITIIRQLRSEEREIGFLEVQYESEELLQYEHNGDSSLSDVSIYLFSPEAIVYPVSTNQTMNLEAKVTRFRNIFNHPGSFSTPLSSDLNKKEYVVAVQSTLHPYTIVYAIPEQQLFAPLLVFRNVSFFAVVFLILFSAIVFYILSRILTYPLIKLRRVIDTISLEDKSPDIENKFNEDAIEMLNRSFRRMNDRLQYSMEEIVQFRTMQLQSQFETLQAQINPHFLFNMLGVIKALADRERNTLIAEISGKLAQFLQYPLATKEPIIHLAAELNFVQNYLDLMKSRYMHRLEYTINFETQSEIDQIAQIKIPKLTLQPLVENCIQHGFSGTCEVLQIFLDVTFTNQTWVLTLADNGPGFTTPKLAQIQQQIAASSARINSLQTIDPLTIGGMGLISSFTRLKLLYKENLEFTLGNRSEGGALIRISIHEHNSTNLGYPLSE